MKLKRSEKLLCKGEKKEILDDYMKFKALLYLSVVILLGCSTAPNEDVVFHVISHDESENSSIEPSSDIFFPFYGNYNFILPDDTRIFYHIKSKSYRCVYGMDLDKPFNIHLTPEDLKEIKKEQLSLFLATIKDSISYSRRFNVSISSPTDTIRNPAFKTIIDFFRLNNVKYCNIRKWTEEEQYSLNEKLKNIKYDPDTVKWLVGFGDK